MNWLFRLRRLLSQWVLRGRLLDWWVLRRGRQIDVAYLGELAGIPSASSARPKVPNLHNGNKLRQILYIADCLWGPVGLAPEELSRIADTSLLDLHAALATTSEGPEGRALVVKLVREFVQANRSLSPDVVILYLRPGLLSDEVFDVLRQAWTCPLFGMNLDDKMEFFPYGIFAHGNDNYQFWAGKYDMNITNCLPATDWYRQKGLPCLYSPQGVHFTPDMTFPTSADFKYEFSFLGQVKVERTFVVNQLRRAGIEIRTFGRGWPDSEFIQNPNEVFRCSQLNLGIGLASPSLTLTTTKARDFECPAAGGCYLATYTWELPLLYDLGKEILCYRNVEELIEVYAWYRRRPEECLKIAQAGWRRCAAEHTWEKRFRKIFEQMGFSLSGLKAQVGPQ